MELLFHNGFGGFDRRTGEYVIDTVQPTPMPWVNCVTCVSGYPFGFVLSESGGGFVWSGNSQSGRLTPWLCQLVRDPVNERIFITADDGTEYDCIARVRRPGDRVRFGKGYGIFQRPNLGTQGGLSTVLTVYAAPADGIKCSALTVTAQTDTDIQLTYDIELENGVRDRVCVRCNLPVDETVRQSSRYTVRLRLHLKAHQPAEVHFFFGDSPRLHDETWHPQVDFEAVTQGWTSLLSRLQITTPEPALDVLMNGWLLYQVQSCRLDGRSGYYQSGGAYGFRDQLQDVLALLYAAPERARAQILLHASRQYEEGDVQHWWHPPQGAGVRTHCSDDLLWLVYATSEYVRVTGDTQILHEPVSFIRSQPLSPEERDRYEVPEQGTVAPLGEHLRRAVFHSLRFGTHGLPLMGSCDWNDGMSAVGVQGRGESVWLSWFLQDVIGRYVELAGIFDPAGAEARKMLRETNAQLRKATEQSAWDGDRYLRAFCDDGTVLGAATSPECRIDAIAQAWACISGAGASERVSLALDTAVKYLADFDNGVIRLLTPAFSKMTGVGYIAAYPPGIRENGGQYTHGAIWLAKALLMQGSSELGYRILMAINPIRHTESGIDVCRYRGEPYVISADIYAGTGGDGQHGRAGWSWYTGSASWYYRVILEDLLGFRLRCVKGETYVAFYPNVPEVWKSFTVTYRFGTAVYNFTVEPGAKGEIKLEDDGQVHSVKIFRKSVDRGA